MANISYTAEREICKNIINRNRITLRENVVPTHYLSYLNLSGSEIEPIESRVQNAGPRQGMDMLLSAITRRCPEVFYKFMEVLKEQNPEVCREIIENIKQQKQQEKDVITYHLPFISNTPENDALPNEKESTGTCRNFPKSNDDEYKKDKVEDLKYRTWRVIQKKLNENKNWLRLCKVLDSITTKQKKMLDNSENPGEELLDLVKDETICNFITMVQEAGLKSILQIFEESDDLIKFLPITNSLDEQLTRQAVFDQAEKNLKKLTSTNVSVYIRQTRSVQIGSENKMFNQNLNEDLSSTSPMAPSRSSSYASEYSSEEDTQTESAIPTDYSNGHLVSSSPKPPSRSSSSEYLSALDVSQTESSSIIKNNPNKLIKKFDAIEYLRNVNPSNKDKGDMAEASDSSAVSVSNDSSGRPKPSTSDTLQNTNSVSQDELLASEKTASANPTESPVPPEKSCETALGVSQTQEENSQNQDIQDLDTTLIGAVCLAQSIPSQDINGPSFQAEEETILKMEDSAQNKSISLPSLTDHLPNEASNSVRIKKQSNFSDSSNYLDLAVSGSQQPVKDISTDNRHGDGDSGLTMESLQDSSTQN